MFAHPEREQVCVSFPFAIYPAACGPSEGYGSSLPLPGGQRRAFLHDPDQSGS